MKPKGAVETTVKTVTASVGMLWDWLSRDPNAKEKTDANEAEKVRQLPEETERDE